MQFVPRSGVEAPTDARDEVTCPTDRVLLARAGQTEDKHTTLCQDTLGTNISTSLDQTKTTTLFCFLQHLLVRAYQPAGRVLLKEHIVPPNHQPEAAKEVRHGDIEREQEEDSEIERDL